MMSRWHRGRHRADGTRCHSDQHAEMIKHREREADAALRAVQSKAGEVNTLAITMRLLREDDNFSKLFGDALGGV